VVFKNLQGCCPFRWVPFPSIGQPFLPDWPLDLGFGCSQFWKLPWFRSHLPVESPCRADTSGPAPRNLPLREGEHIRPAPYLRRLSGYL